MDLYRYYDTKDRLLYVGISIHAAVRMSGHRRHRRETWWKEVAHVAVEHLDGTRADAERIEAAAIRSERPRYNIVHRPRSTAPPAAPTPPPSYRLTGPKLSRLELLALACPGRKISASAVRGQLRALAEVRVMDTLDDEAMGRLGEEEHWLIDVFAQRWPDETLP